MNLTDFTFLINKPDAINERQESPLEKIIEDFPYFQSARILRLKYLYNQNSFKYNNALKVAAAYTNDRTVLFDFITSTNFKTVQNGYYDQKVAELLNINVVGSEIVSSSISKNTENTAENSIIASIKISNPTVEEKLELGKPLKFSEQETHSFQEWLQLARFKPIERTLENKSDDDLAKKKQLEIIDKFIELNPKIPPINKETIATIKEPIIEDKTFLMTETLAKVYLEQKKYQRAIQAYEILILKYPEKSSFFANRILDIKDLQKNNS